MGTAVARKWVFVGMFSVMYPPFPNDKLIPVEVKEWPIEHHYTHGRAVGIVYYGVNSRHMRFGLVHYAI